MASPAGNRANALVLTFTLVSGVIVFFRLFTRIAVIRNAGLEDLCIALAMTFSIGLAVAIAVQVQHGMGKHIYELTDNEMVESQKAFWGSIWLYNLSLTFTKISILIQYLRIFPTRRFSVVCYIVLGAVALYGTWAFFGSIFLCYPVRFFWDKSVPGGKCLDQFAIWFSNASMNITQDFVILLLPMPVLRGLSIPQRQKRALMMIFALGGLVCIISIVRLQSLLTISNSKDPTFDNPPAATLSAVEANVGIITACLPSLRPLLSSMMPGYFPSANNSQYTNMRNHDEEQAKPIVTVSPSSRPQTGSTAIKHKHSRSPSNISHSTQEESELGDLSNYQATVAGTGTRVNGLARQVHIRSASQETSSIYNKTPRLPRLPEHVATIGSVDLRRFSIGKQSSRSRSMSSPLPAPLNIRRPKTPVAQKPLPITPFPVMPTRT